jgi:uncharacterized protein (TIGR03083 family)
MIHTVHLFAALDEKLIELLRSLTHDDWDKPTIAKLWTVKDIAAHLLDTNIRTLSMGRDKHRLIPDRDINSYQSLVDYLNKLNADWVAACRRISPQVLTGLLEITGKQYTDYMSASDLTIDAPIPVAWAGEQTSKNWFHVAREFTEKWHHQQQVRDAVGRPGIMNREFFYPVMDTFMRGLPHTYRNTPAEAGTTIQITIDTETGGSWFLVREKDGWQLSTNKHTNSTAALLLQPDTAWKLFTKGIPPEKALEQSDITGDKNLAQTALHLIAVMA